jgi:hypothetical protein
LLVRYNEMDEVLKARCQREGYAEKCQQPADGSFESGHMVSCASHQKCLQEELEGVSV